MTRPAPRREQVSVAELLVRSAVREDASGLPGARHRQTSLARIRVLSVVAGALAITGGVAAAVSQPVEHGAGAVWPPVGLEPLSVELTPPPGQAVVPPVAPASGASAPRTGKIVSAAVARAPKSAKPAAKSAGTPKHAAPVRHEAVEFPGWFRGGSDRQVVRSGHRDGGHGHHHHGGGRHRR
jgi:hypothetical protein